MPKDLQTSHVMDSIDHDQRPLPTFLPSLYQNKSLLLDDKKIRDRIGTKRVWVEWDRNSCKFLNWSVFGHFVNRLHVMNLF